MMLSTKLVRKHNSVIKQRCGRDQLSVLGRIFGIRLGQEYSIFLSLYGAFDYSLTEIARNSGIGWKTLHTIWPQLEKYGIVKYDTRDRACKNV